MTCIIALKENDKVYMISDRRVLYKSGHFEDLDHPKIIQKENFLFGFAGDKGFYDISELIFPLLDFSKFTLEQLTLKISNILFLFRRPENLSKMIITDGKTIKSIDTNGSIITYDNFAVIGVGDDVVYGVLNATKNIPAKDRLFQAIKIVSTGYSKSVSEQADFFEIG